MNEAPRTGWLDSKVWMVASLIIVCLVSAFGLSYVYSQTKPQIERQREDAVTSALAELVPAATRFETVEPGALWHGLDENASVVGVVIKVAPRGYAGPVETMVGVDMTGHITGVRIASPAEGLKETPGLGLKAREIWFRDQFKGLSVEQVRLEKDGGSLDAISAATITSRAVVDGIAEGLRKYVSHFGSVDTGAAVLDAPPDTLGDTQ